MFRVTRLPDWQYLISYCKPANQLGRLWIRVADSAGNPREFVTVAEAVEEAVKQRKQLLRRVREACSSLGASEWSPGRRSV